MNLMMMIGSLPQLSDAKSKSERKAQNHIMVLALEKQAEQQQKYIVKKHKNIDWHRRRVVSKWSTSATTEDTFSTAGANTCRCLQHAVVEMM